MLKKLTAALAAIALVLGLTNILAGAQTPEDPSPISPQPSVFPGGSVYYLNFKPEQAAQWEETYSRHRAHRCLRHL